MRQPKIAVNEIYGPTIQGEGSTVGVETMFLRTAGCNLACVWCDTPFTWNWKGTKYEHPDKYDPKDEVHKMTVDEIYEELVRLDDSVKHVVISGGEPMLQQEKLIPLLELLKENDYEIEIETNGTQVPTSKFLELVDIINCSPKLSNSGKDNPKDKREIPAALHRLAKSSKVIFKFVVVGPEDLDEIYRLITVYKMKRIYLMPEGRTREEQLAREEEVKKLCKELETEHLISEGTQNHYSEPIKVNFSPRLHIKKWGAKRGV